MIERLKPQLQKALPKHVTTERLARVALTAVRNNPKLGAADPMSLMGAIMTSAQLGLEPNTPLGQAYLIPYGQQVQFQLGYKGLVDLAHRSKQYRQIMAMAVDEADEFRFSYGLNADLHHVPSNTPSGNIVAYYAMYKLVNGGYDFKVWPRAKVEEHAKKYSQSYKAGKKDSPWFSAFDQMACKTVLIDLLRYAPKSVELAQAVSADSHTLTMDPNDPDLNVDTLPGDFELSGEDA
jgi:recombination protein RecT